MVSIFRLQGGRFAQDVAHGLAASDPSARPYDSARLLGGGSAPTSFLGDAMRLQAPTLAPIVIPASGPGDTVPDSADTVGGTNPVLAVTGPGVTTPVISSINAIGDQDFYQVTLVAGVTYEFGLYAYGPINGNAVGPMAQHLTDPFLELYGADGTTVIVSADGGATTTYNNANSGFDVLLTFTPTTSGTYYLNARAFGNSPLTPTGDSIGDYQIFAREQDPNDPNIYTPYYEPDEPLYAIDWGSQVNRVNESVRNPDGNEGTRNTGNAPGTPTYGSGFEYDSNNDGTNEVYATVADLAAAQGRDITGKNVITIYFAKAGDIFTSVGSLDKPSPGLPPATITAVGVQQFERDAVFTALAEFEKAADVIYLEVDSRDDADFVYTSYQGTPGPGVSLLGSMSPPDEPDEGLAQFNSGDERWNATNLAQGGFSFVTLIHEFGHGHGLAHPHDNGGRSGIMNGVEEEGAGVADYTTGDFELNQGVFTMMSYEDGWQSSPYGNAPTNVGYGYLGGLMAFDIAAIQEKYGVNEEWATGNDTYVMKDVNAAGTFYYSIWDAGGNDTISYTGTRDTTIDLRPATLQYETGGGGRVSFATGIFGGFTIANGVTIENATSGSGNDTLHGNAANNVMNSGDGNDAIFLQAGGDDTVNGGGGNDGFIFGGAYTSADIVNGGAGTLDQVGLQGNYSATALGSLIGVELVVLLAGSDTRFGDTAGNFYDYSLVANAGTIVSGNRLTIQANTLRVGEDFTFNGTGSGIDFLIYGGAGADNLTGGSGSDGFFFGQGRFGSGDIVNGGAGSLDQLGLQGDFTGANAVTFGAAQLSGLEFIVLLSAGDNRFGASGGTVDYDLTMDNGNVGAGQRLIISANTLGATESLTFRGFFETNGSFQIFSGAGDDVIAGSQTSDDIWGAAGNDFIEGQGGADTLRGGAGNDSFHYLQASHSTNAARDQILDFATGDLIDLSGLASNTGGGAFSFIGSAAQNGARQLQVIQTGSSATVNLFIDGDAVADLVISVTVADGHTLTAADFDTVAGAEGLKPGGAAQSGIAQDMAAPDMLSAPGAAYLDIASVRDMSDPDLMQVTHMLGGTYDLIV